MSVWKFQLVPAKPGVLGERFGVDCVMRQVAEEVNNALRYPFRFHKVNKLVIQLGESGRDEPDYNEVLGVGTKRVRTFGLTKYRDLDEVAKIRLLREVIHEVFDWLIDSFEDSQCFREALARLNWKSESGGGDGIAPVTPPTPPGMRLRTGRFQSDH